MPLFSDDLDSNRKIKCKRETILGAKKSDWLEWQAGYASGAYLMPVTYLHEVVREVLDLLKSNSVIQLSTSAGKGLVSRVKNTFSVSNEAARVRLLQLNYVTENETIPLHCQFLLFSL